MISLRTFRALGYIYVFLSISVIIAVSILSHVGHSGEAVSDQPVRYCVTMLKLAIILGFQLVLLAGIKLKNVCMVQWHWWFLIIYMSINLHNSFVGAVYYVSWDHWSDANKYILQSAIHACLFPICTWIVQGVIRYVKNKNIPERSEAFQAFIEKSIHPYKSVK